MKTAGMLFVVLAVFLAGSEAIRADEFLTQSMQALSTETVRLMTGVAKDHKGEPGTLALIKYVVVPSKAEKFISVIRESKKDAEEYKGYRTSTLVKTADDNLTYWFFAAWDSVSDLKDYLESKAAKRTEEFLIKEDIPAFITPLLPPLA